jgi:hypothetical protein
MMTILEAVGDYLVTNGQGTLGTNLFLGVLPESPDECVAVIESEGASPEYTMGVGGIVIDSPNIQILVRAGRDDYPTARDKANTIRLLLAAVTNQTISTINVMRIESIGSVGLVGLDEKSRPLISANFRCMVRM